MVLKLISPPSPSSPLQDVSVLSSKPTQQASKLTQHKTKPNFSSLLGPVPQKQLPKSTTRCSIYKEELNRNSIGGLKFIRHEKLLSELSTWGIGGPCNYYIQVSTPSQLIAAVRYCRDHSIRFLVIGKGSNCLFDDHGFDGCVILNRIEFLERIEPGVYRVGSGNPFNRLGLQCCNEGFSGLEFAAGIPGTVGGATYMNAGANGQETANVIDSVEILTIAGKQLKWSRNDLIFGYRKSFFQNMEDLAAVTAVTFRLSPSPSARAEQQAFLAKRRLSQPVGERSAGSVFQNPTGFSAGELIEKAGLKGFRLGGAKVSEIHANFFINYNNSTCQDMLELINLVKERVNSNFGVQLKEEVRYVKCM